MATFVSEAAAVVVLLLELALARFPSVGTRVPELVFFTSIGRATTFLATMELLFIFKAFGIFGTGGVAPRGVVDPGLPPPFLRLTIFAWPRKAG